MGIDPHHTNVRTTHPKGDLYVTPKSLIWVMRNIIAKEFPTNKTILEPCSGIGQLAEAIRELELGYKIKENDLYFDGVDYISKYRKFKKYKYIITNPPFSLWNDFVLTAKKHATKFMFIGRTNSLHVNGRYKMGLWNNLKHVYLFNRYVDFRTPPRDDGLFYTGAMGCGWFLFDMTWNNEIKLQIIDVNKYSKLGMLNKATKSSSIKPIIIKPIRGKNEHSNKFTKI